MLLFILHNKKFLFLYPKDTSVIIIILLNIETVCKGLAKNDFVLVVNVCAHKCENFTKNFKYL